MKPANEMTLGEIEYLVHAHEWLNEKERRDMFLCLAQIRSGVTLITQRATAYRPGPGTLVCDCDYCEAVATRAKKDPPVHFSLD
jgi:hypothetical protein